MDLAQIHIEGRYRLLYLDENWFLLCLRRLIEKDRLEVPTWAARCDFGGMELPADVFVDSVHYDFTRRAFAVLLGSAEFEPVPAGEHVPGFTPTNRKVSTFMPSDALPPGSVTAAWKFKPEPPSKEFTALMEKYRPMYDEIIASQGLPPELIAGQPAFGSAECWGVGGGGSSGEAGQAVNGSHGVGHGFDAAGGVAVAAESDVSLPPVTVHWVGEDPAQAPSMQGPLAKSEARLALEYDLRQLLPVVEGGILDRSIANGPDLLLEDGLRRARAGNFGDAVRYLTRAE